MLNLLQKIKLGVTLTVLVVATFVNAVQGTFPSNAPLNLTTAYQLALERTESVEMQHAVARQANERIAQTTGRILPNISLLANYLRQDASDAAGATSSFTRPDQSTIKFSLLQPLFRGFGEFAEARSRKAQWKATKAQEQNARLALYSSVAQAYFNVLATEKDAKNLHGLLDLTEERVKELKERSRIGRSRKGELLAAESQVATLQSQIESAEMVVQQAREAFSFATGADVEDALSDTLEEAPPAIPALGMLLLIIESRPEVDAAKLQLEAAEESVLVAQAGHSPSLDLSGNYYVHRTGVLGDSKWDIGVQLTVPLFQGGVTQAAVREASDRRKEKELSLAQSRRAAIKEIRTLHKTLLAQMAQNKSLERAIRIAEQNYDEQKREYRYGLATHLDVLQAMNSFQETKRIWDRTRYQALASYASLCAATGQVPSSVRQ